jgi:hypothetical protein
MLYRLGRRPVRHTGRTRKSLVILSRHLDNLGPAPTETRNYIAATRGAMKNAGMKDWSMMLNDREGDCVCADTGHVEMHRTANAGGFFIPTDDDVQKLYEAVGGYDPSQTQPDGYNPTDQGCDETTMEEYLTQTGFCGRKLDKSGMVDYTNQDHLIWAIELFGSVRLGINFASWAMDAFNKGQPWGDPPPGADTTIEGGHDVPLVDFRAGYFTAITWAGEVLVSQDFLNLYCEEAHAELAFDWIQAQGQAPSGFSLDELASDLGEVA